MKQVALIFIVLLMAIAFIYADGGSSAEQAEHWEKVRQLDQLAERFKEDTGFTGEVAHSLNTMRLHVYRGSFSDIPFSADADTTAFREACERIVEKLLPYSPANRMQLSMCRIRNQWGCYTTDYKQQVGGYRVEGSGFIMITYDAGRKHFSIGDNTVELPDGDLRVIIKPEAAESLALSDFNNENYASAVVLGLFYSKEGSERYYLSYSITVSSDDDAQYKSYQYWIDAKSGEIKEVRPTRFLE